MDEPRLLADIGHRLSDLELAVRLEVGRETLALVGPSGAGKSSVLRTLAGLIRPDRGRIELGGRVLLDRARGVDLTPERRRVGMVFQDGALFPHLDVAGNVAFGLRAAGVPRGRAARETGALLERFSLTQLARARPATLSGGERQRVALARTVAAAPEALLLDEPLSALDAVAKREVAAELGSHLRELGLPAILVSHDFEDVLGLAPRIAVIERGRIVQTGSPADLLESPASSFVAGFAGVNYFVGTATRRGDLTEVVGEDGAAHFLSTDEAHGHVAVVVYPWEVALSEHQPEGSALNTLAGPIARVTPVANRARVTVASRPPIVAEVTEESVGRMRLEPGITVVATWKATGTRLVPAG